MLQSLVVAACLAAGAGVPLGRGTQLSFRGGIESTREESGGGQKSLDLTIWVASQGPTGAEVYWLVEERGRGEFPWPARFGRTQLDTAWRGAAGPALLYDRGDGRSVVPIRWPWFATDQPLAEGTKFVDGQLESHVERLGKSAGRTAWQVSVRDSFGPRRTLWVDEQGPLVLAMREKVNMGRGDEYQLRLEFAGSEQLAAGPFEALLKVAQGLTALVAKLNLPAGAQEIAWKDAQLAMLRQQLPPLAEMAIATPLAPLIATAARELEVQSGRSDHVAALTQRFDGYKVEDFSVPALAGPNVSLADLKGQVTVLHFWDYRDEPLKEPYGQVGYLDFVYHRRQGGGLKVYGVAVDGRLADERDQAAARRGVRRLIEFMNLSYPVLLDSGALVKQFGDPRVVGASLPLFVVIDREQTVRHYHVGHYEVHRDQGLKELDEAVLKALEAR